MPATHTHTHKQIHTHKLEGVEKKSTTGSLTQISAREWADHHDVTVQEWKWPHRRHTLWSRRTDTCRLRQFTYRR